MRRDDVRIATMATVPSRINCLQTALRSLRSQVEHLSVYLNGHKEIPPCVHALADDYVLADVHGDRGDAGKFFWSDDSPSAWHLTCDDDFAYAPNYVKKQIEAAMRLNAAVSLHGVVLSEELAAGQHVDWLKEGRSRWIRACDLVDEDVSVHILGTGVGCYHTDLVCVSRDDFLLPNSADIWFSSLCQKQGVPRFVWAHPPNLATQIAPPLPDPDGPKELRWNGEYSARVASCAPWTLENTDG